MNEIREQFEKETGIVATVSATYIKWLEAKVPRWISVDERLPERNGYILAVYKKHLPYVALFHSGSFHIDMEHTDATHWMPLPKQEQSK